MKNKKVLNKKISTEIGVGVVLLVAIVIGGAFYLQNKKEQSVMVPEIKQSQLQNKQVTVQQQNQPKDENNQNQTQQQDQVVGNIKKHTNSKYGFEFEYPTNLVVTSTSTDDVFGLSDRPDGHWIINVTVSPNLNNFSLSQALTNATSIFKSPENVVIKNITIGGTPAKRYSVQNYHDNGNAGTIIVKGGNIITIYGDDSSASLKIIFETVLNSFKFIK